MKKCARCKKILTTDKFNKDNKTKDGLRHSCRVCRNKSITVWRSNNKDKIKKSSKKYYEKNKVLKGRKKVDRKTRLAEKYKTDIKFKLSTNLRNRINIAIKNGYKGGSAVKDLGCSVEELVSYLKSKFLPGMTWENHKRDGWHIDHIKPLSNFDLTDRDQFLKAAHYTNLQPLWGKDNLKKGNK